MLRLFWLSTFILPLTAAVVLPVEVVGKAGITGSATVSVRNGHAAQVLSLRIHNLAYAGMVSVRVNDGDWAELSNETAVVAEPGKSYGGIGGGFATLRLTIPVAGVRDGENTVQFRFNRSNGVASGFRVLAFQFLDREGLELISSEQFIRDDPTGWKPPPDDVRKGRDLWSTAALTGMRAHCGDCHTRDGHDLKYFNYSNASIVARAQFHGLTELEGRQIAGYIRALPGPSPGRPWNPPYQPGPGGDAASWAAGAGLDAVLNDDSRTLGRLPAGAFRPDGDLDARAIPIAMQLPDWNHWLPRVHPVDFPGAAFEGSEFAKLYAVVGVPTFDKWVKARRQFLGAPKFWTPALAERIYSAQLWQLVKAWEVVQRYGLEESRVWPSTIPAATAPEAAGIPDGPSGIGGSALTNEYFNNAWYELQVLLNDGGHRHRGRAPVDWVYLLRGVIELQRASGRAEPGRLLVVAIKSMQSTDPFVGPVHAEEGWRPERNIDPRLLLQATFDGVPKGLRRGIAEAMLMAWLDKNEQYAPPAYFERGRSAKSYAVPRDLRAAYGGRGWEAMAEFRALGVSERVLRRLAAWGNAYMDMVELFRY